MNACNRLLVTHVAVGCVRDLYSNNLTPIDSLAVLTLTVMAARKERQQLRGLQQHNLIMKQDAF